MQVYSSGVPLVLQERDSYIHVQMNRKDTSSSLILSHENAQDVLIEETVIRGSVVDNRPELISERVLVERPVL